VLEDRNLSLPLEVTSVLTQFGNVELESLKIASESKWKSKYYLFHLMKEKLSDSQKDLSKYTGKWECKRNSPQNKNEPNFKNQKPIKQSPSETDLPEINKKSK